jgi:hypothetical protein
MHPDDPNKTMLFGPAVPMPRRTECASKTRDAFPEHFCSVEDARVFLAHIILPPSKRWAFISVGKSGSTSVLRSLFRAEYGCELTVAVTPLHDVNPQPEVHMLAEHGVFSRAILLGMTASDMLHDRFAGERICVVRDPFARAVSAFRYLGYSHEQKSRWFARHRFRMNALMQFDWDKHCGTRDGFVRFLEYVQWQLDNDPEHEIDGHWKPQATSIKPAVFQPSLVGRMEDFAGFIRELEHRFDLPPSAEIRHDNRQDAFDLSQLDDAKTRALCERAYACDYEAFGY